MENKAFKNKDDRYYNIEKSRMVPFFPQGPNVVLDLGCATGRLGRKLRELNKACELVGVEIFEPAAEEAKKHYDALYLGDLECLTLPYKEYFDFVICGDILEHLRQPEEIVKKIHIWLKEGGILISSIPNIRYWRILRDLVIFGKWEYCEVGILDNTHLRFFTRQSFLKLLEKFNFSVIYNEMLIGGKKQSFFNKITFGIFEEFLASQIMVLAKKLTK